MTRQATSTAALVECEDRITGARGDVLRAFRAHGPGTSAEVLRYAGLDENRNLMRARVTELADSGHLVNVGAQQCRVTGRTAIVWRAIGVDEKATPRVKPIRVELTAEDVEAVRKFYDLFERDRSVLSLTDVHRKILEAGTP